MILTKMGPRLIFVFSILLILVLLTGAAAEGQGSTWTRGAPMPTQRTEVVGAAIGTTIYAIGGIGADRTTVSIVEAYDSDADSWREVTSMPVPLHHTAVVSFDSKLYVIGGYLSGRPSEAVYIYDPETDGWNNGADMLTPRGALTLQVANDRIYAIGGVSNQLSAANEAYDPIGDTWTQRAPIPTPREHLASGSIGGKIYVIGGRTGGIESNLNTNEEYDTRTDSWRARAPMPSQRGGIVGSTTLDSIIVFGGEEPRGTIGNVEEYFPANDSWKVHERMPTPRHGLAAVTIGENIYVIGGGVRPGFSVSGDNEVYNLREMDSLSRPTSGAVAPLMIPLVIVAIVSVSMIVLRRKSSTSKAKL